MLGLVIAIRNFIIAVLLAWIGITYSPPAEDSETVDEKPSEQTHTVPATLFKLG